MNNYSRTIGLRLRFFGVLLVGILFIFVWRMCEIGVVKHDQYLAMAKNQQRFEKTEMGQRGRILVHDSAVDPGAYYPLAFDVRQFAVWVVPRQVKDKQTIAGKLQMLLGIPEKDIFDQINNDKLYIPPLKRGLDLDQANSVTDLNLDGVFVMPEYSRLYPESTLASQILGFVNADGEGNYGFEGHFNAELKGKEGDVIGEKDTLGRVISLLSQNDPEDGTSYVLTIDRSVQYFVEKKLAEAITTYQAESGTVLIMDIKTGGIMAMANYPTYDPNSYKEQASADSSLFMNPAISSLYEPGSVFKTIVMASAIDAGAITPDTTQTFGKSVNVLGHDIHTAEDKAFGTETMSQVLQNSDNVGMVWVAEQIGRDALYKYINAFGFGDRTGIPLQGEASGQIPSVKNWDDLTRSTISFGQGISVTPIELLTAYATIANNGKYVYPQIVDKIIAPDGTEKQVEKQEGAQVIKPETAKQMQEMLYSVVAAGHGVKSGVAGFKVGSKTGTAQIPDPVNGGYLDSPDKLGIYNHTLAGLAPTNNPEYAMIVKLTKPKTAEFAEATAAPLFGDISSFLLNYHYRTAPTEPIK